MPLSSSSSFIHLAPATILALIVTGSTRIPRCTFHSSKRWFQRFVLSVCLLTCS